MKECKRGHVYPNEKRQCPECAATSQRRRYLENREDRIADAKRWAIDNPEKKREYSRRRWKNHKPEIRISWEKFKEGHPLHSIWTAMKCRCYNPNDPEYANYGGRGITVSEEWRQRGGYRVFEKDMWPRPSTRHTLDRINNDLGYSKENCKWSTRKEQRANQRTSCKVAICGIVKTKGEWATLLGLSSTGFNNRLKRGWTGEKLLQKVHAKKQVPLGTRRRLENAVVRMFQVLGDAEYDGRDEIVDLLKDLDLFSVAINERVG